MSFVFSVAVHVVVECHVGNMVAAFVGSRAVLCGVWLHVVCCACFMFAFVFDVCTCSCGV